MTRHDTQMAQTVRGWGVIVMFLVASMVGWMLLIQIVVWILSW